MKRIIFVMMVMLGSYTAFGQHTNKLVNDYIVIKNALVSGDSKAVSKAVASFQQTLKEEGNFSGKDVLVKATDNMAKATAIEKQRDGFNEVSTSLWAVVKGGDKVDMTVYYQYCPMKKAYWISETQAIKNPYYGAGMLTCGKVVETR
ncbi:DUF3347 domain-containing protein [Chitinophaga sp.]|uniref:DUF3347 domain-containing protein n=1 Tax=Chitinophaga sp. TaxID=1869181 RepID=UPI0031DD602E